MCLGGEMATKAQAPAEHKTENVILVMIDGMRWDVQNHLDSGVPLSLKSRFLDRAGAHSSNSSLILDLWQDNPTFNILTSLITAYCSISLSRLFGLLWTSHIAQGTDEDPL